MEIEKLFTAIEEGKLFHLISQQTKNGKSYLKFKRHDSIFDFIYTPAQEEKQSPAKYVLLKGEEKARAGTLKVMWQDYKELGES